jgi:hypothetical protein
VIVEKGETLINCLAYIDLNPLRAGLVERPEDYRWNSLGYLSLSNTFIAKFLTLKDTEDFQSPPASLTQTAFQNEPFLLANQFR